MAQAQYRFDSWTTDNGLPQNSVYSIVQTADGYIWLTTLDGLVRFDGVRFTVFNKSNWKNLPSNRFIKLFAEADNTLWICTEESGLVRYRNGEFQTFTTADGLPSNNLREVLKDTDGSLLIFTENGIARFRDNRFSIERKQDFRDYKIYITPSGTRWEMDKNGLRATNRNGGETRYDLPFDTQNISADRTFNYFYYVEMLEDSGGALWFSAAGNLYKLKDGATTVLTINDGMPPSLVRRLAQDRQGDIWFGTEKDGACRLAENRFVCFDAEKGLSSNKITDIFSDREGTLWITTNEKGFNRVSKQIVTSLSTAAGLFDKNVFPILEDSNGAVWLGSFSALSNFKDGKITNYTRRDGLLYEIVQSLFEDRDGRLWIGSLGGVERLENGIFTDFTERLGASIGDVDFWDIHQDRGGAFWFATNKGLIKYDGAAATRLTTENGLPGNDVKAILETREGKLWFGTYDGLAELKDGKFVSFSENEGLTGNHVRAIYEDVDGTLWIGTYDSGLSRFKNGKFTNYTIENGLYSNGVFQILEDGRGNFWMSSNQGIYRVSRGQLNDFADGKRQTITSTVFGKSDGMLNTEANGGRQPAGIKARDGKLWFPTQDGAAIIDPEAVAFNPLPPPVVIESVKIDDIEQSKIQNLKSEIQLTPSQHNLEIHYTGLSFIKPEQMQFRYRLEGLDEDWTNAGVRREAFYPYLPPGKYTFRVIAANSDSVWNEQGAWIEIVVQPPFYRTAWFIALTILSLTVIGFALYKRRVSELKRKQAAQEEFSRRLINAHEAERSRVAAELHDSIGQSLAMIKNRAVFGAETTNDLTAAREQFDSITSQTTQAISEVREISYNLRPYLLERLGLTKAIKSLVNKIEEVHLLKIEARIDDIDHLFASEAEMSVYRIVQESLNNAAKHAETERAMLTIEKTSDFVLIKIEDFGRGFDKFAHPKNDADMGGFGLLGITERVRMLGGTLDIQTEIDKGTKLTIQIHV